MRTEDLKSAFSEVEKELTEKNRQRIGAELAAAMKARNLTASRVAEITGIDAGNISKLINGKYNASLDILSRVCIATGCKLAIIPL